MDTELVDKYTLRSKNTPLVDFSLYSTKEEALGTFGYTYSIKINKIYNENSILFPKNLKVDDVSDNNLLKWIERRKAPKNRQFVDKILSAIEDSSNPLKYVDVSYALSLNDCYWVTKESLKLDWKDINLYSHPFDTALSYVAFTGYSTKISGLLTSPELTSSGALKKCWSNRDDGIYLIKGDSFFPRPDGRSQATMEFYAAQVADALGFEHINYDLEEFHHRNGDKEIVCVCKLFTTENEGYVEAATFFKDCGIDVSNADLSSLKLQQEFYKKIGPFYADMMLFDSIIANNDRHLGNFGVIVDNNTGKYLRHAPLFDNGSSLLYGAAPVEFTGDKKELFSSVSCKFFTLDRQAKLFVHKRHLEKVRKLLNFEFKKHPKYNIADDTLKTIEQFVRFRAKRTIELYHEKEKENLVFKTIKKKHKGKTRDDDFCR